MKTLVTGGCGFIGSNLVASLGQIADITILDNLVNVRDSAVKENIDLKSNAKLYCESLDERCFISEFDRVFHLAANVNTRERNLEFILSQNSLASVDIIGACKPLGNIVMASSAALYGNSPHGSEMGYLETQDLDPLNYYAYSKRQMELLAQEYCEDRSIVFARFFNVYGRGDENKDGGTSLLTSFCQQALAGRVEVFKGTYQHRRDFVHVDDVVKCLVGLSSSNTSGCDVFNIGSGENVSIEELLNEISCHISFKVKEIACPWDVNELQKNTLANNTKIVKRMKEIIPNFSFKGWWAGVQETLVRLQKKLENGKD